jgi:cyclic dehypoxanthinyl futalosine synthase
MDAGLNSIGETAAAVPGEAWANVHRAAHALGMRTTARVVFGAGETFEERLAGLETVRRLQEETGGFVALAPISYHAEGGRELDETTAIEYLKTLAVSRMYVDNIDNVEADWTTQGLKVLQMGLRFGANDVGAVQVERTKGATEEELRRVIRDAGFRPAQRELGYRAMLVG